MIKKVMAVKTFLWSPFDYKKLKMHIDKYKAVTYN